MTPTISIVAPAYDEEDCIEATVRGWLAMLDEHGVAGEIVVADDGSRDRTPDILKRLAAQDARVRPLRAPTNRGYGRALVSAIDAARGDFVVTIDSDGQFDPADIPRLLTHQRQGDYDLVTGRRRRKNDGAARVVADRALNRIVRGLFDVSLSDTNCALKLGRRGVLQALPLRATGYPTPTEIVVRAHHAGLSIGEIPVAHLPRAGGTTKLRFVKTAASMLVFLLRLRAELSRSSTTRPDEAL